MINQKIIDYIAVWANSPERLQETVRSYLKAGWQPLGGVSSEKVSAVVISLYQAMVKYEKQD